MKKIVAIILYFILYSQLFPQDIDSKRKYVLTKSSIFVDITSASLLDNYLSPLPYSGIGTKLNFESVKLLSPDNLNLSSKKRFHVSGGVANNPSLTASMMYWGLNYGWGMYYHFRFFEDFQVLTGGIADIDFLFKTNLRNVNNPVNFDLGININAAISVIYDIQAKRRIFRLQADFESPLIGIFFAPQLGSSYYEMFSLGAKGDYIHFGSLHNKVGFKQRYFIEIPLKKSTWRIGLTSENFKYSSNGMMFKKSNLGGFLGYTRTLFSFNRKNPVPANFIIY